MGKELKDVAITQNGTVYQTEQGSKTKRLILRILRWAEINRRYMKQMDYIISDNFRADLHQAVVIDTLANTEAGISKVEKREANGLWKKYAQDKKHTAPKMAHGVTRKF
tara:strand:- start:186 stop:512 length:327 start_codon:yes stop_codon:yes gene_type:complete